MDRIVERKLRKSFGLTQTTASGMEGEDGTVTSNSDEADYFYKLAVVSTILSNPLNQLYEKVSDSVMEERYLARNERAHLAASVKYLKHQKTIQVRDWEDICYQKTFWAYPIRKLPQSVEKDLVPDEAELDSSQYESDIEQCSSNSSDDQRINSEDLVHLSDD